MNTICPVCDRTVPYRPGDPSGCTPECRATLDARAAKPPPDHGLRIGTRVRVDCRWSSFNGLDGVVDELREKGAVIVALPKIGALRFDADSLVRLS